MKKLLKVLVNKEVLKTPPIWIMRQAGRYLPQYLETRAKAKNFLDLCYNPKLACEVTLQPIKQFDFDAAIIFSDILVIPDALGQKVDFVVGHGPKLAEFNLKTDLSKLKANSSKFLSHLQPVFEAISDVKASLSIDKALIGFAGSPWTLACYMIEGGGSKNFERVRRAAIENSRDFQELIDLLTDSIIEFLRSQVIAGCDVIKIFDSWAGILPPTELEKWVILPTKKIVNALKQFFPDLPIICFPKGIGLSYQKFASEVQCDCSALDNLIDRNWAKISLQKPSKIALQGNLDNFLLAFGSQKDIAFEVEKILADFAEVPFVFNLGHGILPQTPIANVELLMKLIRK
jgi:uroporphyrinogen decarboxylase